MIVQPMAPDQALKVNAEIPVASGPNPAADAFLFKGDAQAREQALNCLASAVYYEAGNQDENGERAVAQVVLNRVRHPAFPASICGVVYQGSTRPTGCQFTFTCDGSLQPAARRRRLATGDRCCGPGARGGSLLASWMGDALPRRLCRPILGLDHGQERCRRRSFILSLGRRLGTAGSVFKSLCGP